MVVLPNWLALGLLIAAAVAIIIATIFLIGQRLYPDQPTTHYTGVTDEWKPRQEIRSYLTAIDERYTEDTTVNGHPVAFYLPTRNVAITFDGTTYFRLSRTDTHAILVEHEMPGSHLGTRLPFDTPDLSHAHTTETDDHQTPFQILGLDEDATVDDVTTAYRTRIKDVHPDHGGDEESFRRVREAYTAAREQAE